MWVKVEIVDILSALHPLEKTTQQGGGDSRKFNSQKYAQDMHSLSLSTTADSCRLLNQYGQQAIDRERTETEDDSVM